MSRFKWLMAHSVSGSLQDGTNIIGQQGLCSNWTWSLTAVDECWPHFTWTSATHTHTHTDHRHKHKHTHKHSSQYRLHHSYQSLSSSSRLNPKSALHNLIWNYSINHTLIPHGYQSKALLCMSQLQIQCGPTWHIYVQMKWMKLRHIRSWTV